jgi:hypothetical protein
MLSAKDGDGRWVKARNAIKGVVHFCPDEGCRAPMVLKRGAFVVAHFAHPPGQTCNYADAKSIEHLTVLDRLDGMFAAEKALEGSPIASITVDQIFLGNPEIIRRPDILLTGTSGKRVVVEYQRTALEPVRMAQRTAAHVQLENAMQWIVRVPGERAELIPAEETTLLWLPRVRLHKWQQWAVRFHETNKGTVLFFEEKSQGLYAGTVHLASSYRDPADRYNEDTGEREEIGGYWKELTDTHHLALFQVRPEDLRIGGLTERRHELGQFAMPQCHMPVFPRVLERLRHARRQFALRLDKGRQDTTDPAFQSWLNAAND